MKNDTNPKRKRGPNRPSLTLRVGVVYQHPDVRPHFYVNLPNYPNYQLRTPVFHVLMSIVWLISRGNSQLWWV